MSFAFGAISGLSNLIVSVSCGKNLNKKTATMTIAVMTIVMILIMMMIIIIIIIITIRRVLGVSTVAKEKYTKYPFRASTHISI
jgi:uncharacterized protein HemY